MPEYPDVTVYLEALAPRVLGQPLEGGAGAGPGAGSHRGSAAARGHRQAGDARSAARASGWCSSLEDDLFLVLHLMIAGRLHWRPRGAPVPGRIGLAAFDFPGGTLVLTEASPKKRAQLWLLRGEEAVRSARPRRHRADGVDARGSSRPRSAARTTPSSAR